jgi:hypothetical protein
MVEVVMSKNALGWLLLLGVVIGATSNAHADDGLTPVGLGMALGTGATAFTGTEMKHAAGLALMWQTRVTIGTRIPFALEVTYSGTERGMGILGTRNASLESEAVDATIRFSPLWRRAWCAYVFGGIGWQRHEVTGAMLTGPLVAIRTDEALVVPVGAGLLVRLGPPIIIDVRGTYRDSRGAGVLSQVATEMSSWETTAAFGIEF